MYRKIDIFAIFAAAVLTIIFSTACASQKESTIFSNDSINITYKYGKIEFADEMNGDIYTDDHANDTYTGFFFASLQPDSFVYTYNTYKYLSDANDGIPELCRDPVCDHSVKESCIQSFGSIYYVVCTSDYIYFTKGNGVYRYSLNDLTTEPYAVFNAAITNQFLMGKYLYIEIASSVYVKVDLESSTASMIMNDGVLMSCVYPHDGQIYFLDEAANIYVCDSNFDDKKLLVGGRRFDCAIQSSFQPFENYVYYTDRDEDVYKETLI